MLEVCAFIDLLTKAQVSLAVDRLHALPSISWKKFVLKRKVFTPRLRVLWISKTQKINCGPKALENITIRVASLWIEFVGIHNADVKNRIAFFSSLTANLSQILAHFICTVFCRTSDHLVKRRPGPRFEPTAMYNVQCTYTTSPPFWIVFVCGAYFQL